MRKKFGTYIIVIIVAVLLYRFARHYTSFDVSNFSDVVSLFEIILTLTLTFLVDRQQRQLNQFALLSSVPMILIEKLNCDHVLSQGSSQVHLKKKGRYKIDIISPKQEYYVRFPIYEKTNVQWWHAALEATVKSEVPVTSISLKKIKFNCGQILSTTFRPDGNQTIYASFMDGANFFLIISACLTKEMIQMEKCITVTLVATDITGRKQKQVIYSKITDDMLNASYTKLQ